MSDLLALEAADAAAPRRAPEELGLCTITSPLTERLPTWRRYLAQHPDRSFGEFILRGLSSDFRIGCAPRAEWQTTAACRKRNMLSALANRLVVTEYLEAEQSAGRVVQVGDRPLGL